MATYQIRIYNQSMVSKSYVAFMQAPVVSASGGEPQIFTNAWASFPHLTNGSYDTIDYVGSAYAFWAQPAQSLTHNTTIGSGGVAPVNTATQDTVAFSNTDATGFTDVTSPGTAQTGSFSIVSSTGFTPANNFVFGLARDNGTAIPAPIATFPAEPNQVFNITPVEKFYVADGHYAAGQVIDVTSVSHSAATIDFTGRPQTTATVIQGANGVFTVTYS